MMNPYPFDSILLDGREVRMESILSGTEIPRSDFDASTFSFISLWLKGATSFVQQTSGSTGTPKAITLTREQMIASAEMTASALGLKAGDRALVCLSPEYIAGKMMIVRCFVTGMKIIAVTPSANPFLTIASDQPIDFAALVPYQIQDIIASEKSDWLNHVKTIIIGGAPLSTEMEEKLRHFNCKIFATYGMTETISHIALRRINGPDASEYYSTLPGIGIELDDRKCLVIKASQFPQKIITNDLVEITSPKQFKWLGRWDNVINTGGLKVIPEKIESEIEKIFNELKINQRFFVSGEPDEKLGRKVVLIVEGTLKAGDLQNLKKAMGRILLHYEVPREVYSGISFIHTENGKINRKATVNLTQGTKDLSS